MAVINNNLVFYASSGMPINDTYRSGGDINSGIRVLFTDLDDSTTITTYSSDRRDQNTVLVSGWNNSQNVVGESIDVDGTGRTVGSVTFSGILCAKLEHATGTGTITISGTNENVVGRIPIRETGFQRPFYLASSAGGATKTLYEKIYLKNNNTSSTLLSAKIVATGRNLVDVITIGLEDGKALGLSGVGVEQSVANRTTAPSEVSSYGSGITGVWPSGTGKLLPTDYQGVWLKAVLPANSIFDSYYTLSGSGYSS